jgi:hypothetical protein
MQRLIGVLQIAILLAGAACQTNTEEQDTAEETISSEAGTLPADVLSVTKPLINGQLYSKPDFDSPALAHFDTAQQIQLLDTTGMLFLRARIDKNKETFTGYISKAIIPEQF